MKNTYKKDIILFSRDTLDEIIQARLGMKVSATDNQWDQVVDYIHSDDEAWGYINHAVDQAVEELLTAQADSWKL